MRDRLLIVAVALAVRVLVAWLFFGSVDTTNDFLNAERMFGGTKAADIHLPYFPGLHLILWLGGVIAVYTPLPLTFGWKFFGVFFDAVLALLVFDYLASDRRRALRAGLLYAVAPVPLLIASIHGQRDAVVMAFLLLSFLLLTKNTRAASALAGAAFVLSVIIKPIALPFLPLLFASPVALLRGERRAQAIAVAGGALATAVVYLAIAHAAGGTVTMDVVKRVLTYAEGGVQLFGFPFLLGRPISRFVALLPLLVLVPAYWKGLLSRERVVLISFAVVFGLAALSPQYLMWIVPLLLICGHARFAAVYSLIAGWFLLIHYHHPGPAGFNIENVGAFGPLRGAEWLAPSVAMLATNSVLYTLLSSFCLPLLCLGFAVVQILRLRGKREGEFETPVLTSRIAAPAIAGLAIVAVASAWAVSKPEPTVPQFQAALAAKVSQYAVVRYRGPGLRSRDNPSWVIPAYAAAEPPPPKGIDAVTIGYAWVVLWSAAAWMSDAKRS